MADISPGYSFSGVSPNNNVTAEKLNALVGQAVINATFFTGKAESTTAGETDYLVFLDSGTGVIKKIRKSNLITSGVAKSGFTNLQAQNNVTTPDSRIDVTAVEVVMRSTDGNVRHLSSFSRTVDIASYSGAPTPDGRDSANENSNTWYYFFAISDGVNDRLIISESYASPNLPAGYIYFVLLGCARNNASSNFVSFYQRDFDVALARTGTGVDANADLNPYTTTASGSAEFTNINVINAQAFRPVDVTRCCPPIAGRLRGYLGLVNTNGQTSPGVGAPNVSWIVASRGFASGLNVFSWGDELFNPVCRNSSGTDLSNYGFWSSGSFDILLAQVQSFDWSPVDVGVTLFYSCRITGYRLNL